MKTNYRQLFDKALKETIKRFEETGSPVITDGEQTKPSFATYPISGIKNLAPRWSCYTVCRWAHKTIAYNYIRAFSLYNIC